MAKRRPRRVVVIAAGFCRRGHTSGYYWRFVPHNELATLNVAGGKHGNTSSSFSVFAGRTGSDLEAATILQSRGILGLHWPLSFSFWSVFTVTTSTTIFPGLL
jgi:hypothetical protein